MGKLNDLTGQRFSRLVVLRRDGSDNHKKAMWLCRCDCGEEKRVVGSSLLCGNTTSCGCAFSEQLADRNKTHGLDTSSSEYNSWANMKARCLNPKNTRYSRYGGRGIKICDRWLNYENFFADMGPKPTPKHTIERLNNDGNYEPDNCVWASREVQARNKSTNVKISVFGETKTISEWSQQYGLSPGTLRHRIRKGWSEYEAVTTPANFNTPKIKFNGKYLTAAEWEQETGIASRTLRRRLERGWSPEKALTTPVRKQHKP